jgi:hypothetical protein
MAERPLHLSNWPYLQLFEIHRLAVEDGLFTEHLSESISPDERKVFMKYMRSKTHEFTKFVTHLFLTYRQFEENKLFTVKKASEKWRELQVVMMSWGMRDGEDVRIQEKYPDLNDKQLWQKKKRG